VLPAFATSANHRMKFQDCKCGVLLLEGVLGVHPWRNGAVGRCAGAAGFGQGPWGSRTLDRCAGGGVVTRGAGSRGGVPPQSFAQSIVSQRLWRRKMRWLHPGMIHNANANVATTVKPTSPNVTVASDTHSTYGSIVQKMVHFANRADANDTHVF
jgi:hypothetical protein